MGKAKKGKKDQANADENSEDVDVKQTEVLDEETDNKKNAKKSTKKEKKKPAAKQNDSENENDVESEVEDLVENVKKSNVKGKKEKKEKKIFKEESDEDLEEKKVVKPKGKSKKVVKEETDEEDGEEEKITKSKPKSKGKKIVKEESDHEEEEEEKVVKNKGKAQKAAPKPAASGFSLLMGSDDDDDEDNEKEIKDDDDEEPVQKAKQKNSKASKKQTVVEDEDAPAAKGGKKSKKSKKKKGESDDEDIEKMLAELELEYSGVKKDTVEVVATPAAEEPEKKDKKKEKKNKKKEEASSEAEPVKVKEDDGEIRLKTAAEKKREKKERQKKEDLKSKETTPAPVEAALSVPKEEKGKQKPQEEVIEEPSEVATDVKEIDKKAKRPNKAMVAIMQERLRLIKDEEERMQKEEEEKTRVEELTEQYRLQQFELEKEKKEKKRLKEKERRERLKAEGKLSNKQKLERARAQAMLDSLRAQGLEIPEIGGEKKVRLGTRFRPNKAKKDELKREDSEEPAITADIKEQTPAPEENSESVEEVKVEVEEPEEEKVKDAWDASDSEEEKAEEKKVKSQKSVAEESEGHDDDEDDDDEDGSDSGSEDESDDDDDESEEEEDRRTEAEKARERAHTRISKRTQDAEKKRSLDNLRASVVCVLGHVDTGKTKILDKLRRTNVQDAEAGGITQQIGATNVPIENIKEQTKFVKGFNDIEFKLPGLLIIDTPGHESFSNLRSRGSSLCDIAILVVDIMHGLEPQTIESINLLKAKKTPFLVALNKIDRLYDWQTMPRKDMRDIIKAQASNTMLEFTQRTNDIIVQFAEQSLNAALFYENPDPRSYVSLVPTSAITGEGMGNLLFLIVQFCQNQLAKRLMFSEDLQATVLEVKAISGLGTTIDAILINGKLREGDTMILAGTEGPIVTQIKALLMPQPMKELRVKNAYIEHKEIMAAQGVKIAAKELEKAIAGLNIQIAHKPDEVEIFKDIVARELKSVLNSIKLSERGVYVQASTLGSLEALLEFLKTSKIPYSGIRIGPVVKRDVMKASTMLEHENQYATILAFDVKIERDAQDLADHLGVKIFQADIIYHLFDKFTEYREEIKKRKREEFKSVAVFPCKLKILPQFIFNSRDPIVMGVIVEAGVVKEGTPICVPSKEFVDLGVVTSIECNHKQIETARKGQEVCIKIEPYPGDTPKMFGRHFEDTDMLVSKISRQSIDACKDYFRDDLLKSDWTLMVELKKTFQIL